MFRASAFGAYHAFFFSDFPEVFLAALFAVEPLEKIYQFHVDFHFGCKNTEFRLTMLCDGCAFADNHF